MPAASRAPWDLGIAGVRVRLHLTEGEREALAFQHGGFACTDASPVDLEVDVALQPTPVAQDTLFCTPAAEVLPGAVRFYQGPAGGELFSLNVTGSRGVLHYRPSGPDRTNFGPAGIRGALAAWVAAALVERDGLLLHGAGVVVSRPKPKRGPSPEPRHMQHHRGPPTPSAVVALGPSGAGKSTFSAMFPPTHILSDELVALRLKPTPMAHSTPFSGTLADPRSNQSAPLRGLLILNKGPHVATTPEPSTSIASMVMQCLVLPKGLPHLERQAFASALALVGRVVGGRLTFTKDSAAVRQALRRWPPILAG